MSYYHSRLSLHVCVCVCDDITIHFYMMRANQKFIIIIGGVKCNKKVFFLLAFDEMRNVMSQNGAHTHMASLLSFSLPFNSCDTLRNVNGLSQVSQASLYAEQQQSEEEIFYTSTTFLYFLYKEVII